jgi:hypothetical protein
MLLVLYSHLTALIKFPHKAVWRDMWDDKSKIKTTEKVEIL